MRNENWLAVLALVSFALTGCAAGGDGGAGEGDDDGAASGTGGAGGVTGTGGIPGASIGASGPASVGAGTGTGGACSVAAEQVDDATCKVAVTIDTFSVSSSACWVDSPLVTGDAGDLSFACGNGPATLSFPSYVFTGTSSECTLDLTLTTQFEFSDGCTWQSEQHITGPMDGQLVYTYSEHPIAGTSCASPCTVDATLSLEQSGPVEVEPPK